VGELPDYISKNKDQFSDWFSKNWNPMKKEALKKNKN
mgnify:CR=1